MKILSTSHLSLFIKSSFLNSLPKFVLENTKGEGSRDNFFQLRVLVLIIWFLFFPFLIQAHQPLDVVINEIAWMGTKANSSDEWVELYNNTEQAIPLEGWGLYEAGGETLIEPLTGIIETKSYYLIERTDDRTISDIPASQPPSGWEGYGLSNSGEHLQLRDQNSRIIDEIDCSTGWFVGEAKPNYRTMERKNSQVSGSDPNNWATNNGSLVNGEDAEGNPINGTPKAKNSVAIEALLELEPEVELLPEEPQPDSINYPSGIFINEILPDPEGVSDAEGEYVEIFNENSFVINLSGWKIRDAIGAPTTYTFPEGKNIDPEGFLVIFRPETKITLNNLDGDSLKLIQPDGTVIDEVNYQKAIKGQSYNRTLAGWVWSEILTPGLENIISSQKTEEAEPPKEIEKIDINTAPLEDLVKIVYIGETRAQELISLRPFYSLEELTQIRGISDKVLEDIKKQGLAWVDPELKPPKTEEIQPSNKELAAVSEPFKQGYLNREIPKSLFVFLIALSIAIFSGIIVLILKRKLKSFDLSKKLE